MLRKASEEMFHYTATMAYIVQKVRLTYSLFTTSPPKNALLLLQTDASTSITH